MGSRMGPKSNEQNKSWTNSVPKACTFNDTSRTVGTSLICTILKTRKITQL